MKQDSPWSTKLDFIDFVQSSSEVYLTLWICFGLWEHAHDQSKIELLYIFQLKMKGTIFNFFLYATNLCNQNYWLFI